jgi:hypothetical protein
VGRPLHGRIVVRPRPTPTYRWTPGPLFLPLLPEERVGVRSPANWRLYWDRAHLPMQVPDDAARTAMDRATWRAPPEAILRAIWGATVRAAGRTIRTATDRATRSTTVRATGRTTGTATGKATGAATGQAIPRTIETAIRQTTRKATGTAICPVIPTVRLQVGSYTLKTPSYNKIDTKTGRAACRLIRLHQEAARSDPGSLLTER